MFRFAFVFEMSQPTISSAFVRFLQSVDGDKREKEWVMKASGIFMACLFAAPMYYCCSVCAIFAWQVNAIQQELDLVGLGFEDLTVPKEADASQRSWAKR